MATDYNRDIKLYHYTSSPYARKIVWYLALRGLPYTEIRQPVIMPRPDLQAIGVAYRRIPLMAIGKDIYCDTRIILAKLEELFPEGKIGGTTPDTVALQNLLSIWHVEGPVFWKGVNSMPSKLFSDTAFQKDREQMTGRPWNLSAMNKQRPESMSYVRSVFGFLEALLADSRDWILATASPSLADIEAVFVVHWLHSAKALPEAIFPQSEFPKTFAWIGRFDSAVRSTGSAKPTAIDGSKAAEQIFASGFAEAEGSISTTEPQQIGRGDRVELFPTDSGSNNKDHGILLSLTDCEIVIGLDNGLRLHTPRAGFRVSRTASKI